jgi:hypothetical protein
MEKDSSGKLLASKETMKHLRWHADPDCTLGVSGRAKLVEEYNDTDRNHRPDLMKLLNEIKELSFTRDYYLTREQLIEMYERNVK